MPNPLANATLRKTSAYIYKKPWDRQAQSFMDYAKRWAGLHSVVFTGFEFKEVGPRIFLEDMVKQPQLEDKHKKLITTLLDHLKLEVWGEPQLGAHFDALGITVIRNFLSKKGIDPFISCYARLLYNDLKVKISGNRKNRISNFKVQRQQGKLLFDSEEQKENYRLFLAEDLIITQGLDQVIAKANDFTNTTFKAEDYQTVLALELIDYIIPILLDKYFDLETAMLLNQFLTDEKYTRLREVIRVKVEARLAKEKLVVENVKSFQDLCSVFKEHIQNSIEKAIIRKQAQVDTEYILTAQKNFEQRCQHYEALVAKISQIPELCNKIPADKMEKVPHQNIDYFLSPNGDTPIIKYQNVKEAYDIVKRIEKNSRTIVERNENLLYTLENLLKQHQYELEKAQKQIEAQTTTVLAPTDVKHEQVKANVKKQHTTKKVHFKKDKDIEDNDAVMDKAIAANKALVLNQAPTLSGSQDNKELAQIFNLNEQGNYTALMKLYHSRSTTVENFWKQTSRNEFKELVTQSMFNTIYTLYQLYGEARAKSIFLLAFKDSSFFNNKKLKTTEKMEVITSVFFITTAIYPNMDSNTYSLPAKNNPEKIERIIECFLNYNSPNEQRMDQISTAITYAKKIKYSPQDCEKALGLLISRSHHFPIRNMVVGMQNTNNNNNNNVSNIGKWTSERLARSNHLLKDKDQISIYQYFLSKIARIFDNDLFAQIEVPFEIKCYGTHDYIALCTLHRTINTLFNGDVIFGHTALFQFAFHYIQIMMNKNELYKRYFNGLAQLFDEKNQNITHLNQFLENLMFSIVEIGIVSCPAGDDYNNPREKEGMKINLEKAIRACILASITLCKTQKHMKNLIDLYLHTHFSDHYDALFEKLYLHLPQEGFNPGDVYEQVVDLMIDDFTDERFTMDNINTDSQAFWKSYEQKYTPKKHVNLHLFHVVNLHNIIILAVQFSDILKAKNKTGAQPKSMDGHPYLMMGNNVYITLNVIEELKAKQSPHSKRHTGINFLQETMEQVYDYILDIEEQMPKSNRRFSIFTVDSATLFNDSKHALPAPESTASSSSSAGFKPANKI